MPIPIYAHIFFQMAEETIMHANTDCTKYDQERQYMKEEFRKTGVQELSIKTLMNLPSGWSSRVFFEFIRQTGLMCRI